MNRRAMTWKLALLATAERARQGADAYAPGAMSASEDTQADESDTTAEAARKYHRGAVDAFERIAAWASELALKESALDAGRTLRRFVDAGHMRALDRAKAQPSCLTCAGSRAIAPFHDLACPRRTPKIEAGEAYPLDGYLRVVALSAAAAQQFTGRVDAPVDLGAADSRRYDPGARVFGFKDGP